MHTTKSPLAPLLLACVLICYGYIAAQQRPTQQSAKTQNAKSQPAQQNDQLRDQVAQLQKQVQDLQAAMDDLRTQEQVIGSSARETRELVLSTQIEQKQAREKWDSLIRAVGQHDRQIDELGRQVSSMMRDLGRVKTKVGLY